MNRKAKKAMAMGMAALVAVTSVGGNTAEAAVKKLTKKATVTKSLTVKVGKTKKISVKKVPKKTKVTYKTNKKKIATVTKKGVVKGVKKGKAVITVKLKYKKKTITKKCNVTVKKATTTKVTATATPTVPAQVPTATPVAPTATPGTNATATPGADVTATPGADATETPGSDAPTTTTPGAVTPSETPTGTETPGKDETEKPDDVTSGGAVTGDAVTGDAVTPGATTKILNVTSGAVTDNKVEIDGTYDVVNVSAEVGTVEINVDGTIGTLNLESGAGYTVNLNDVTVDNIAVAKDGDFVKADATKTKVPTVNMTNKAEVKDVKVSADVTLKGKPKNPVKTITVDKKASVEINVPAETVTVSADKATVSISSNVDAVKVKGSNVKITVDANVIVAKMEITGDDTTITGEGKIEDVEVNGNNTVIEDVQTDKVTVSDEVEGTKINDEEVAAGTKRTSSTMTFTTANDYAYMMVTSGGSVSAYAVSSTAVKDFYDGKETVVIYDEISLEDGKRVRKEAEVTGYEEKGKVVSLGGITCTVSGNKNKATVVVSSDVAEVQFIGYKQYTKADEKATLEDGDNTYVITYAELRKAYGATEDKEISYTKNDETKKVTVKAGSKEITIDGITCKAFVDENAMTADVIVLKSGVVLN